MSLGSEDYAARAGRAALDLNAAIRELDAETDADTSLWFGAGIDAGLLRTRSSAADAALQLTGAPQKVAASLALDADPDQILISPACRRLLGSQFKTTELSPVRIRGRRDAVSPFKLEEEVEDAAGLTAIQADGLSPFAGRRNELQLLASCLQRALSGEGSTGKHRRRRRARQDSSAFRVSERRHPQVRPSVAKQVPTA